MRVNADVLLTRAATTSTSGTLNDLTTDLIMANKAPNDTAYRRWSCHSEFIHQYDVCENSVGSVYVGGYGGLSESGLVSSVNCVQSDFL